MFFLKQVQDLVLAIGTARLGENGEPSFSPNVILYTHQKLLNYSSMESNRMSSQSLAEHPLSP